MSDPRTVDVETLRTKYRPESSPLFDYVDSVRLLECPLTGLRWTDTIRYSTDLVPTPLELDKAIDETPPVTRELVRGGELLSADPVVVDRALDVLKQVWEAASKTHCALCGHRLVWTNLGDRSTVWLDRPVEYRRSLFHIGCAWDLAHDEEVDRKADAYVEAAAIADAESR